LHGNGFPGCLPSAIFHPVSEINREILDEMVVSLTDQSTSRYAVLPKAGQLARGEFFAALLILGCANGLGSRIIQSVHQLGWADALSDTFGISVIVWLSCIAGISIIVRDRTGQVRSADVAVGAAFVFLIILPIGPLSWLAVTTLCIYILVSTNDPALRRGAVILFATTVPMLWSRMLFQFFANQILQVDASLVGWLLGTHRTGTLVEFADSSGQLAILPGCSSLANVSLAFLCWVTVSQFVHHKSCAYDILWCLLACASVVTINITRISIEGLSQWHYTTFHSPWGDAVANTTLLGLTIGFSVLGVRREFFSRT
jgi:hypothetical protein